MHMEVGYPGLLVTIPEEKIFPKLLKQRIPDGLHKLHRKFEATFSTSVDSQVL